MTPALQSVLSPAGPDAELLARLAWVLFAAGAALFLLVACLAIASLRQRKPARSRSRMLVLGGGLVLPLPLLAALMAWSGWQASQLTWPFSGAARLHITVTAHMWWWELRYRDTRSGREAVLANELRLPAGERVYLALASADVQHAFWVPALGAKVDMVPGRLHGASLRAAAPGRYRAPCAEYCGTQHAAMALDVVVQEPAAFETWFERQSQAASGSTPSAPAPAIASAPASPQPAAAGNAEVRGRGQSQPASGSKRSTPALADSSAPASPQPAAAGNAEVRGRGQSQPASGSKRSTPALADASAPALPQPAAAGHAEARGREVFLAARCNACHTVRGVAEGGRLGPDLTHLASRRTLAAGALPLTRAALTGWIANPQAAKPGARMPPSSLPPQDLQALAAWLETLE